ncbi:hypothetical protein [Metabacillus iocasae]|uniref:Uncharacterized protein n=1 Tax=Priestia iocasae TaxID=2291674 RepID=A0ABS2QY77_9BACI|nr:hypothetical protein [Metabacillus iocasae]MBM7704148.1 hypothetical protein [Metabacillus iocasae]
MSTSKIMKWITGSLEAVLGIPFLGGAIILGFSWTPLLIMLGLHIVTLVLTKKDGGASAGSIVGIITSCIGWIPIVGMMMHIITALLLFVNALQSDRRSVANQS